MTSMNRWKLACAVLAAVTGYTLFWGGSGSANEPADTVAIRGASLSPQFRRPLRISADAAGISQNELVDALRGARNLRDIQLLADKLGMIGDDAAIDAVKPLLADNRRGVPEAILGALGKIGTEKAIEILIAHTKDDRPAIRNAAITAIGSSQSVDGETAILAIAKKPGDPAQTLAIASLGRIGSDRGVTELIALTETGNHATGNAAVIALGTASTDASRAALRKLIDASDSRIAAAALQSLDEIDDALLAKLTTIVKTGDPQIVNAALSALGKAGEPALPALREAALHGPLNTRWAAVTSLSEINGAKSVEILGEILKTGDLQSAAAAASALANTGGTEARGILIEVALSDRGRASGALAQLTTLEGDDVDQALLTVLKDGSSHERRLTLPRLLRSGNQLALDYAVKIASSGTRNERYEAMRALADADTTKSFDALVDIAGKTRGQTRVGALDMIALARPTDPALAQLLSDSLFSGRRDESGYAANVLGRMGTDDARQALIAALGDKDKQLVHAAASALSQAGLTPQVKTALLAAAQHDPQMKAQIMNQFLHAGAPEGIRLAEEVLNGDTPGAAHSAIYALAQMGTPESKRLLERALSSRDPGVRMAAIATLGQNPDDHATDTLLRLARDTDPQTRQTAIATLGQMGSEKAAAAIIDATRSGTAAERAAAISALGNIDDARANQQIASLIRDSDPQISTMAINAAYNGGPEVDQALTSIVNDPNAKAEARNAAAYQLRNRGSDLDDATEQKVTELAGPAYGGYGYAGYYDDLVDAPSEDHGG